jgi:hypothetical protein
MYSSNDGKRTAWVPSDTEAVEISHVFCRCIALTHCGVRSYTARLLGGL